MKQITKFRQAAHLQMVNVNWCYKDGYKYEVSYKLKGSFSKNKYFMLVTVSYWQNCIVYDDELRS